MMYNLLKLYFKTRVQNIKVEFRFIYETIPHTILHLITIIVSDGVRNKIFFTIDDDL